MILLGDGVGNPEDDNIPVGDNKLPESYDISGRGGKRNSDYLRARSRPSCLAVFASISGIIVDSGATSSDFGLSRMGKFANDDLSVMQEAHRSFGFGDSRAFRIKWGIATSVDVLTHST